MTYIASLDPNNPDLAAAQAHAEAWDAECPEWRELSLDPEDRDTVAYNDVENPEEGIIRGYGGDHRRYFPGAFGE